MANTEYLLDAAKSCGECGPTICKRSSDRRLFMVDFSACAKTSDGAEDPLTSVSTVVTRLSTYTTAAANLTITSASLFDNTTVQGLLVGGRASSESHEHECFEITIRAITAGGQRFEYRFRVKTRDVWSYDCDECDATMVEKGSFRVPSSACSDVVPMWCKTAYERLSMGLDFTDSLCLPNGQQTQMVGNPSVSETFLTGYNASNNGAIITPVQIIDDLNGPVGAQFIFSGGVADDDGRGQCYRGYVRVVDSAGQWFYWPFMVKIRNPKCAPCS